MGDKLETKEVQPLLVIVSGPPGAGKTSLGRRIAQELHLPFVYKDGIKETLFEALGWSDREWSRKLGGATYHLLYYFVDLLLEARVSHIVESNFLPLHATPAFLGLMQKHPFIPFQVQCHAEGQVLLRRFAARSASAERHPGHVDHLNMEEIRPVLLAGMLDPLEIGGTVYPLDTTDFSKIDYGALVAAIEAARGRS